MLDGTLSDSGRPLPIVGSDSTGVALRSAIVTAARALLTDLADSAARDLGVVDLGKAVPGSTQGATGQVNVTNAATQIVPARAGRSGVTITLVGDNLEVYYGYTNAVTTGNGALLGFTKGMSVRIPTQASVFAICTTAGPCAVSFAEDFD